jgi:hypothetical protein
MNLSPALLLLLIVVFTAAVFGQSKDELISAVPTELATAAYPFVAIESGLSGTVTVKVSVDERGKVYSVSSVSGPDFVCANSQRPEVIALRAAAEDAAMKTIYKPATLNGKRISSHGTLTFSFMPPSSSQRSEILREIEPLFREVKPSGAIGAMKIFGAVDIKFTTNADGSIFSAEPLTGHPMLKLAAVEAACKEKLDPVKVTGIIRYFFKP